MEGYETLATVAPALFGRVDRCRHRASGDLVAVKRVDLALAGHRRGGSSDTPVHDDIFAELQANLKVQALGGHPFVLSLRDAFMDAGAVHLVLAYCARGELLGVINTQRHTLSVRHKLRYFKQVLLAAAFLHTNGIAHRDLSLENVLVDARDCCQVCDFGLATSSRALAAPSPVGKPHYLAPEACATTNSGNVDATFDPIQADVWSLGVLLFAMLAGRYPFREPLRRDDHFRLLADFGVSYLLAKLDVDTESAPEVADLLAQIFELDPAKRPSATTLLQHPALTDIECDPVEIPDNQAELEENPVGDTEVPAATAVVARNVVTPTTAELLSLSTSLRNELKVPSSSSSRRSSWCQSPTIGTPVVSTVYPTAAAATNATKAKELEVSPAECPKPARLELMNRTLGKVFRKSRSDA